jgi:hypothetical protein
VATGISFGHFNIVGGAVREDGPYVGVIEDRNPAESSADLYLVVEPVQAGSQQFCADLLALAERHFGHPQYSLTGNLLQALRAMQEHLRAWNKTADPSERAAAGCTCLAVRGDEAYLAQVGPGVAFIRHGGRLQHLEALEPEAQAPLGTRIACSPTFSRFQLAQGDTLLLSNSRLTALADDTTTDRILALPPGDALPEIYALARGEREFGVLYLAVTGDLRAEADTPPAQSGRGRRPGRAEDDGRGMPATTHAGETSDEELDESVIYEHGAFVEPAEAYPSTSASEIDAETRRRHLHRLNERRSLALPKPAVYAAIALIGVGLAGWFVLPRLLQAGRTNQATRLLHDAQTQEQSAASAQSPAQKRSMLEKAQADLDEAKLLRPQDPQIAALQTQTGGALDRLNAVKQLPAPKTLLDMTMTQILPRGVTDLVAAGQLYLLDASTGTVYAVNPAAQPVQATPIFAAGKLIESITTGAAQHLAWQPAAGGKPGLLYILDVNRRLFSYDGSGTFRSVGLTGAGQWKSVTGIAAASGNLYVLDSGANQIWRYTPAANGFTGAPEPMLARVDLHDAAQIAVIGDIWVSTQGGRLLRFSNGHEQEVKLSGIDRPMLSPETPLLDPSTGLLYIADAGNQRVVVAGADDTFREQYTGIALRGLRAIALDASTGVLYTLSEQSLVASQIH